MLRVSGRFESHESNVRSSDLQVCHSAPGFCLYRQHIRNDAINHYTVA